MRKILYGLAIFSLTALISCGSKKVVSVHNAEFNALAAMIREKGVPTPRHPHESHRLEDDTYIFTLSKEGKEIHKIRKNTYKSEVISPITPD
jgi:hypothetical protein